jgi:uncharacterized protein YndB with AHSA1/START domain
VASEAGRELLAARQDVWRFLAEPYHLPDWWPGITGVEPDRRGFAPGARWKVHAERSNIFAGRRSTETLLLVREIDLYERWSWHLLVPETDTEVRLQATAPDRTLVTVTTSGRLAGKAVQRLYDLVQIGAGL